MTQSISDDTPNGHCRKCGFHLQNTKGKQKICVNCDIQGDQPTDERNEYGDPGHAAVMKSIAGIVPAKERATIKEPPTIDKAEHIPAVSGEAKGLGTTKNVQTQTDAPDRGTVKEALMFLEEHFASLPVTDLRQAKELLKLRKEIQMLSTKIANFIGGK